MFLGEVVIGEAGVLESLTGPRFLIAYREDGLTSAIELRPLPAHHSITALWSTLAGAPGLRSKSTSGMAASDRIIISLKSFM